MQISLSWLNELLDLRGYPIDFLIERLTVNGFEIEECKLIIYGKKASTAIIISTTANRGDVLSIRGIAREVKLILGRTKLEKVVPEVQNVPFVRRHFRRKIWRRIRCGYGGDVVKRPRRLRFNIAKPNRRFLRHKRAKKVTVNEFKWRIENTIYRSPKWKRNRLYYTRPVFNTEDPKLYSKFICWTIEGLENLNSPKWLQRKLRYSGFIPENNFTDFQNYILLETGYPFEFYDLEKIKLACNGENFKITLDSAGYKQFFGANKISYVLNHETLVLKANDEILSVTGIIPNQKFSCNETTKSFLVEGCIYNSKMVRHQSKLLGLKTNRSIYYSRGGMDGDFLLDTWYRFLLLLKLSNPKIICKLHTTGYSAQKEEQIYHIPYTVYYHKEELIQTYDMWIREQRLVEIFGSAYEFNPIIKKNYWYTSRLRSTHVEYLFQRLRIIYRFSTRPGQKESEFWPILYGEMPIPPLKNWGPPHFPSKEGRYWVIYIPNYRREDLKREIDIIEEVCRTYGVDKMESVLPKFSQFGNEDESYQIRKKITSCLLNEGFSELVSYSLVNGKSNNNHKIKLINPLSTEYSYLRTTLLPSLINIISENIKQGNNAFEGFEYGHVFLKDQYGNFIEKENLAGIFGGVKLKSEWSEKLENLSWFEAKGKLEQVFEKLNLQVCWKSSKDIKSDILHPYRTASIYLLDNQKIGVFGQINPLLSKNLNISSYIYLFELDFKLLVSKLTNTLQFVYQKYSLYPRVLKDLSFIVNKHISFSSIKNAIYSCSSDLLIDVQMLDNYKNQSMDLDQVSLCIQLIFQSKEKTLKTEDIELVINQISSVLINKYQIILRT